MASLLVTGGAGFIGANFVHHWLATHPGDRVVVLDALTYAGNAREPRARARRTRASSSFMATFGRRASRSRCSERTPWMMLVHFAAESHVDRSIDGPDAFLETNVTGHALLLKAAAGLADRAGALDFTTCRQTRCTARSGRRTRRSRRPRPRPQLALTRRARPRRTTWCAPITTRTALPVTTTNCSNNYGPYPVSREADPADARERPGWEAAPGLRRRPERARLALRRRSLPRDRAGARRGGGWARRTTSAGETNGPTSTIVRLLCKVIDEQFASDPSLAARFPNAPAADGEAGRLTAHLRAGSAWTRPAVCHRRPEDRDRAGLRAG